MKKTIALMAICYPAPLLAEGVIERLEQLESRLALLERQRSSRAQSLVTNSAPIGTRLRAPRAVF